jgi:hypothetical protein
MAMDQITGQVGSIGSQAGALSGQVGGGALGGIGAAFAAFGADALQEIRDMLAAIQVMVNLVKTIVGLAKCDTIEKVVFQLADDVCSADPAGIASRLADVVKYEQLVIWSLIVTSLTIYFLLFVMSSPRKPWKCQVCGDHFRFKVALQAHRKVTCKDGVASFTMPVSYNALNLRPDGSSVIPALRQALRADLSAQVISIGTELGFPEYQQKRRSAYGGLEGIDASHILLSVEPRKTYDLDGPVKIQFRIKVPMSKEKPSNRKDVMEMLQDKDGMCPCLSGTPKVELTDEMVKDSDAGLLAPAEAVAP